MNDVAQNILLGSLASLVSSFVFMYFIYGIRPNIKISDRISTHINDKNIREYTFKIINKTRHDIIDVKLTISVVIIESIMGGVTHYNQHINLRRSEFFKINKYNKKDQDAQWALRFGTEDDIMSIWNEGNGGYIVVRIYARHSLSGFAKVFEKRYYVKSMIIEGAHGFGEDMSVYPK